MHSPIHDYPTTLLAEWVETLLIEADRLLFGRIDSNSGEIATADQTDQKVDDEFDDLGEIVLKKSDEVIVAPSDRMPTNSGVPTIYSF